MNIQKLLRHNLSVPLERRVSVSAVDSHAVAVARMRGDAVATLAKIHVEIAPVLAIKRDADAMLDKCASTVSRVTENKKELYGVKASAPDVYRIHTKGISADAERDERDKTLFQSFSRGTETDLEKVTDE